MGDFSGTLACLSLAVEGRFLGECLFGVHRIWKNGRIDGNVRRILKLFLSDVAFKGRNLATVHRIFKRPLADVAQLGIILATIHQIASNLPADVD